MENHNWNTEAPEWAIASYRAGYRVYIQENTLRVTSKTPDNKDIYVGGDWERAWHICADHYLQNVIRPAERKARYSPTVHEECLTPFGERVRCVGVYHGALGQMDFCEVEYLEDGEFAAGEVGKYPLWDMQPIDR